MRKNAVWLTLAVVAPLAGFVTFAAPSSAAGTAPCTVLSVKDTTPGYVADGITNIQGREVVAKCDRVTYDILLERPVGTTTWKQGYIEVQEVKLGVTIP